MIIKFLLHVFLKSNSLKNNMKYIIVFSYVLSSSIHNTYEVAELFVSTTGKFGKIIGIL